jgi:uncharacterized Zn finger protein
MASTIKRSRELTLRDLLSRLSYTQACKLLGGDGAALLREGGKYDIDPVDVVLADERLTARVLGLDVCIGRTAAGRGGLELRCTGCSGEPCVHVAAVLSLVLEEKLALGLSAPPPERVPLESLDEDELVARALRERLERAKSERMRLRSSAPHEPWTDYTVTSAGSGKTYRVALRGVERGVSFCSCPDYRKNTLGTCKHVLYLLERVRRRFSPTELRRIPRRTELSLHLRYGDAVELRLSVRRRGRVALVGSRAVGPWDRSDRSPLARPGDHRSA